MDVESSGESDRGDWRSRGIDGRLASGVAVEPPVLVPWPYVERRARARDPDVSAPGRPCPLIPDQPDRTGSTLVWPRSLPGDPGRVPSAESSEPAAGWTRWVQVTLICVDAVAGVAAALVANLVRFHGVGGEYLLGVLIVPLIWVVAMAICHGYESRWFGTGADEFRCVLKAGAVIGCGVAVVSYSLHAELARGYVLTACVTAVVGSLAARLACRAVLHALRRRGAAMVDVVLVGHEVSLAHLVHQLREEPSGGLRIVGACVPASRSYVLEDLGVPVLGDLAGAGETVRRLAVDVVAVTACAEMNGPVLRKLAWQLEGSGVDLVVAPGLVDVAGPRLHIRPVSGLPLLHVEEPELVGHRRVVKAAIDRVGAFVGLLLLSPVLLAIGIAIRTTTTGPVLFRQSRVGRNGREFCLWKFRTMHVDAEERLRDLARQNLHGTEVLFKMRNDPRVTPLGRWLRRFSLDELPQLVNVLLGHMSLVGPRPPLPTEVARYGTDVHRRLLVKPGLTGLWQIRGRADLSWDESIRLDLRYVENWSLSLDIVILCKTVAAVITGRGAY